MKYLLVNLLIPCLFANVFGYTGYEMDFFLDSDHGRKHAWTYDIAATIHELTLEAECNGLLFSKSIPLSYNGSVRKTYTDNLPLVEYHGLSLKIPGNGIDLGVSATLDISTLRYDSKEEQWSFIYWSDEEPDISYLKSTSRYERSTTLTYGMLGNCRMELNGSWLTIMAQGQLIKHYGIFVDEREYTSRSITVTIQDYHPHDMSYSVKAGMLFSNGFDINERPFTGYIYATRQYTYLENSLRSVKGALDYDLDEDAQIILTGEKCEKRYTTVSLGFRSNWPQRSVSTVSIEEMELKTCIDHQAKTSYTNVLGKEDLAMRVDTDAVAIEHVELRCTIIPGYTVCKWVSVQVPLALISESINYSDRNNFPVRNSYSDRNNFGVVFLKVKGNFSFTKSLGIQSDISSGELVVIHKNSVSDDVPGLLYRAYKASLHVQLLLRL